MVPAFHDTRTMKVLSLVNDARSSRRRPGPARAEPAPGEDGGSHPVNGKAGGRPSVTPGVVDAASVPRPAGGSRRHVQPLSRKAVTT